MWSGAAGRRGIFESWEECEAQIKGFPGARYKSFPSRALAEAAFRQPPPEPDTSPTSQGRQQKYYVVWRGRQTGIFESWEECEAQVKGFPNARYQSFPSRALAEAAFHQPPPEPDTSPPSQGRQPWLLLPNPPQLPSICVDAACDASPGRMEYRGVWTENSEEIFHEGPFEEATNNIGEFLAIVHGLAWLHRRGEKMPVYSDSVVAIGWVREGSCRTELKESERNRRLFERIRRAEQFLQQHPHLVDWVQKWDSGAWGENPADFGRK
jgi:ribonuclease HI